MMKLIQTFTQFSGVNAHYYLRAKHVLQRVILLSSIHAFSAYGAGSLHDASDIELLQAACPTAWSKVDQLLTKPTTVPWSNEADRQMQLEFKRNFVVQQTNRVSRDTESVSHDVITVLSECIKRHNAVVATEFGKTHGPTPVLKNAIDINVFLHMYMMSNDD